MADEMFNVKFDLDVSDKALKWYDLYNGFNDQGACFLKEIIRDRINFFDGDIYSKEVIITFASTGMYLIEVTVFNLNDIDISCEELAVKVSLSINDMDHSAQDIKVT